MSGVDNLNYMYSLNAAGNGQMTMIVDFDVKTDPNTDLMLTQMRETQAASQLPQDVTNFGVTVQKSVTAPLMVMGLYSPKGTYDGKFLANYSYINLNDQLTRVPGIGNVQVFGAGQYAMRLWVKPDQLAKLGITVTEVVSAIQAQNTVNPAGQVGGSPAPKGQEYTYSVRAQGRLTSPEEFGDIVVRELPDGGIVRVRDVARIELGAQDYTLTGRINGKPGAIIAVYQLPGTNAVDAAKGVRKLMEEAKKRFPQDVDYVVSLDTTESVTEGIQDIVVTILIAIALVTVVVYLFLQGWRATLIPLLAVPVSLIGTFIMFPVFGFSINTLSLFGLVLAIGLVVDDAIVVVEAVERHIEEGMAPKPAALKAMEEISGPGDRHRAGALRGVRADRIHSRNHRPPVSAVRGDHRDLGDPVGVQRADAQSRALGPAAQAEKGKPRAAAPLLQLVQPHVRPRHQRLSSLVRRADPQERDRGRASGGCRDRRRGRIRSGLGDDDDPSRHRPGGRSCSSWASASQACRLSRPAGVLARWSWSTDVRPATKEQVEVLRANSSPSTTRSSSRPKRQADTEGEFRRLQGEAGRPRRHTYRQTGHRRHHRADPRPSSAASRHCGYGKAMRAGSAIVDTAVQRGGNCEGSQGRVNWPTATTASRSSAIQTSRGSRPPPRPLCAQPSRLRRDPDRQGEQVACGQLG